MEFEVPPNNTNLSDAVEEFFNTSELVGRFCEDGCQTFTQAEKRSSIGFASETEFFIIILSRAIETLDGFQLKDNKIVPTEEVYIR